MAGGETNDIIIHDNTRPDRRTALADRLWRAAELQAAEVEARLMAGPRPAAETERDAKTLSVLARTLRELSAADAATRLEAGDGQAEDDAPDDVEAFRAALGEKLQALTAARGAIFGEGYRPSAD